MSDVQTTIDRYLEAYGEADAVRRATLVAEVFTGDAAVFDPPIDGRGHAGISEMFAAVQSHYPDHAFRRTTAIDLHHDVARYAWALVAPDGQTALEGLDVVDIDSDGRIVRVIGFLGALEPAAEMAPAQP